MTLARTIHRRNARKRAKARQAAFDAAPESEKRRSSALMEVLKTFVAPSVVRATGNEVWLYERIKR